MHRKHSLSRHRRLLLSGPVLCAALLAFVPVAAPAQNKEHKPSLTAPLQESLKDNIYSKPVRVREIKPGEISGATYFTQTDTLVGRKIDALHSDLGGLQGTIATVSGNLAALERSSEGKAAEYYANVATINTQLQTGTTPGNPRLVGKLSSAESNLETLSGDVGRLSQLAVETAQIASEASFLLETTRASYNLSGAVEEDHVRLEQLEDSVNNTMIVIERILNNVNDDITRTTAYLSSERNILRTLALGVTNGDLYGKSLANRPFSSDNALDKNTPGTSTRAVLGSASSAGAAPPLTPLSSARPLVKIRFDRPDVDYEQPVYMAVNEALARYPNARFELVAVNPTQGNAAQVAIESTRARRNAERVLRTLTQMGLGLDRIDLSYMDNPDAQTNEVHLYIR